jgi:hypothetical protein
MTDLFRFLSDLRGVRAVLLELGERYDPRFLIPLSVGEMNGLQWRRVGPRAELEQPPLPIAWAVTVDDRAPDASGPSTFDAGTLQWLFADAFQIAVDAAEPHMGIYKYLVEEGLKRRRILVIQTVESRRVLWREFTREHCELYGVLELVAVLDNPKQYVRPSVTRFEGRSPRGK